MRRRSILADIEDLKQQLIEKYQPQKIILFGSAAGDFEEVHDVDLFIIKEDVPVTGAERIRQLYRLMDTHLPVDYLVYRPAEVECRLALGDPFVGSICREGKVLYG